MPIDISNFAKPDPNEGSGGGGGSSVSVTTRSVSGATALAVASNGGAFNDTLTGNTTYSTPTGAVAGTECSIDLQMTQNATGGWSITWFGGISWAQGAPLVPQGAAATLLVTLLSLDGGVTWLGSYIGAGGFEAWRGVGAVGQPAFGVVTTLSSALSTGGGAITTLPVNATPGIIPSGVGVSTVSGGNSQVWTTSAQAAAGATSLTVTSATPNFNYPIGSTVNAPIWSSAAGWTPAQFAKDSVGTVHMDGTIQPSIAVSAGNSQLILTTLPVGYRPLTQLERPVVYLASGTTFGLGRVVIFTSGLMVLNTISVALVANTSNISLGVAPWKAEQ